MLLKVDVTIHAPRKKVWDFLTDSNQTGQRAPEVEKLETLDDRKRYHRAVSVGLGSVKARFSGEDNILELDELNHATFKAYEITSGRAADLASFASLLMMPVSQKLAGIFYHEVRKRIETADASVSPQG